jgi:hypothetical protein
MKESNQQHYEGVINHITNEKTAKIIELETKLNAKDIQINDLKIKEGELIAKEKTIASLNRDIERLSLQVGSLSSGKDSQLASS